MNEIQLGPVCAFLSACTWAFGSTYYAKLARDHRPFDVNFSRAVFALPCFVAAVFLTSGLTGGITAYEALEGRHVAWFSLSMISSYVLGDVCFLLSTLALGVPGALAIASSYPVLTALAGVLFEGEILAPAQWCGLALAIAGVAAVILNNPKGLANSGSEVRMHPLLRKKSVGVALALATALAWASNAYSVAKGGEGLHPGVGNTLRMVIAISMITVLSFITTRRPARLLDRAVMRRYSGVFLAEAFLGSYLFMYGLSHSSLVLGSVLSSLAPVLSVPVAIALKLERFSWIRTAAVLTVVVGLSLIFR